MPKDNIERAIAKGTGAGGDADAIETVLYEGYGPGGVALLIEAITENRNRTGADVRHAFSKHGGNLGEPGTVAYLFEKQGTIVVDADALLRGRPAASRSRPAPRTSSADDDVFEVDHRAGDFTAVRAALEAAGIEIESAEVSSARRRAVPVDEATRRHADAPDRGAGGQRRRRRGARQLRRVAEPSVARDGVAGLALADDVALRRRTSRACRLGAASNSGTGPRIPRRRRSPANDHGTAPSIDSRSSRSTSRLPGRATAVIRLARFTGRPNQSPARGSAWPIAAPARSCGKSSPSASAASIRLSAAPSSGSGSGEASIAASPIVLTRRTGGSATSLASASRRTARRPSSSGATSSPSRVKPTRSAKHTLTSREPGNCPPLRSSALTTVLCVACLQVQRRARCRRAG